VEYKLKAAEHQSHIHVETHEDRNLTITTDHKVFDVCYRLISDHRIHMTVNGGGRDEQVSAFVVRCPEGKKVWVNGRQYLVCDLEIDGAKIKKEMPADLPDRITPPMPAVVVRISVQAGDAVRKGQSLIVVSAMKMETALCAPYDGTVAKINCAINDKVIPGQILAEIKKQGDNQK
jgi:biotin carboxyl carrier protein